ncbi:PTS sugar transporter subunit IIB [Myxococcota bacterium]|nr:PTS sugar transporter subunit IIB [Myxococcota bacterium]MBU1432956.1 PTS sugar transporter subunit IIB [Myxococcota bacterium]MBU1896310.1 PTS sugar transporter subunit IIB [Myxococcota bacterium]
MNPFYRVDNRLVHGQIIATWLPHLRLQRIIIANDQVPNNPLQIAMSRMAIPQGVEFEVWPIEETATWLNGREGETTRTLILLETISDARRLFNDAPFDTLNIGNIHHGPGRHAITSAVFLGPDDIELLKELMDQGVAIEIQSLPVQNPINLNDMLDE